MAISIDSMYPTMLNTITGGTSQTSSSMLAAANNLKGMQATKDLENSIENAKSDEELMEACKGFEQYFLEQIFKSMQATVDRAEDEENEYTSMFNDMMIENYAKSAVNAQGYGVAQMLYESMKNNAK